MQTLSILGATGSIGLNTLEVASRHPDRYHVLALTAHKDVGRMAQLCREHRPEYAVMSDENSATLLRERLASDGTHAQVLGGAAALADVASLPEVDTVMAGIVGAAGLLPTLAAVRAGKRVLLANKEPMVMAGGLFMREIARCKATLLPVDSEHNAIFQCMPAGYACGSSPASVRRVLLTASGGPFRDTVLDKLDNVTPEQAVRHPNWVMGPKISVDSATMMNKGLELIEAAWLFGLEPERIDVMLHPQSVVHSLVEYEDGSMLAQMGQPDMRTPIACALAWPQRIGSGVPPLDLCAIGHLGFGPIDPVRYPCLTLARRALQAGGSYPAVLNAANEIAVEAFLNRQISYTGIAGVIEHCLDRTAGNAAVNDGISDLDGILAVDAWARDEALKTLMGKRGRYAGV